MRKSILIYLILSGIHFCFAQTNTVESVPNPKELNNTYVSNPDKLITDSTASSINKLLSGLEQTTTAQVAVVLLNSIGEDNDFDFAQKLFEKWGIGKANKDNGLLILFVKDQKTIRFHTGFGLEGVLPDVVCKRIQTQKMVPAFKEGDFDSAMLAGVEEAVKILTDPAYAEEIRDDSPNKPSDVSDQGAISFLGVVAWGTIGLIYFLVKRKSGFSNSPQAAHDLPTAKISKGQWWWWHYLFPLASLMALAYSGNWIVYSGGLYACLALIGVAKYARLTKEATAWFGKKEYHAVHHFLTEQKKGMLGMAILFPLPFVFIWMHLKQKIESVRTSPRECKNCGQKCIRLDEVAEDEYLSKESQFEEELKSVDYDIWKCSACGEISMEAYINEKTEYSECPHCNTHAFYTVSSTTKVAATTSRTGRLEVVKLCKFCNRKKVMTESIPMIVVSSSNSDSSSSSSSDSGSFGGGDSGGGGASSSW